MLRSGRPCRRPRAALRIILPRCLPNSKSWSTSPCSTRPEKPYDPAQFDIDVYQVGNNPFHTFVYEAALRRPGVVVMHEANLHHLIADYTIRRGNWDAYMAEVVLNGNAARRRVFASRPRPRSWTGLRRHSA